MPKPVDVEAMRHIEATIDEMMVTINRVMLEARLKREYEASITPDPITQMNQIVESTKG